MKVTSFKKIASGDLAGCWYCESKTPYALTFANGDEIWCFIPCFKRHKFRLRGAKVPRDMKSLKISGYPLVERRKNAILKDTQANQSGRSSGGTLGEVLESTKFSLA